jgi:hypothetical protein
MAYPSLGIEQLHFVAAMGIAVPANIATWRFFESETNPRSHFDRLWKLA